MYMHFSRFLVRICNVLNAQPDHWMCFPNTSAQTQGSLTATHLQTRHQYHRYCTSGKRTAISPDCVMYRTQGSDGYCNWHGSTISAYVLFAMELEYVFVIVCDVTRPHRARRSAISQISRIPEALGAYALHGVTRMGRAASLLDEVTQTGFSKEASQIRPEVPCRLREIPTCRSRDRSAGRRARNEKSTYLWLYDFEVPYLDPAGRKIRDLELHRDRPLALASLRTTHASSEPARHATAVFVVAFDGRQAHFRAHEEFFAPAKLLDLPNNG